MPAPSVPLNGKHRHAIADQPPRRYGDPGGRSLHRAPDTEHHTGLPRLGEPHGRGERAMGEDAAAEPDHRHADGEERGAVQRRGEDDGGEREDAGDRRRRRRNDRGRHRVRASAPPITKPTRPPIARIAVRYRRRARRTDAAPARRRARAARPASRRPSCRDPPRRGGGPVGLGPRTIPTTGGRSAAARCFAVAARLRGSCFQRAPSG